MTPKESWRVGVLFSCTGPTAAAESALLNGTLLAIEKINVTGGIRGMPIKPVHLDPAGEEARYRENVRELTEHLGISVIFGGYTSASRKAMIPGIEKTNSLLFYPTFYEGFEYSDHVFYFGSCPNQYTMQLLDHMIARFGSSFCLVGANYVFPRESNRIVRQLLRQRGGKVLSERYLPLHSRPGDAARLVKHIETKKPDVIFSTLVGNQIVDFYKAYDQTDLRAAGVPIASIVTTETEIGLIGPKSAAGHYCASSYFSTINSDENLRFLDDYKARFGAGHRIGAQVEAAFNQMMFFADALNETGVMETGVLRQALLGRQLTAPQGEICLHGSNHHTHLWCRIGLVGADGEVEIVSTSGGKISPDPYLINYKFDELTENCGAASIWGQ